MGWFEFWQLLANQHKSPNVSVDNEDSSKENKLSQQRVGAEGEFLHHLSRVVLLVRKVIVPREEGVDCKEGFKPKFSSQPSNQPSIHAARESLSVVSRIGFSPLPPKDESAAQRSNVSCTVGAKVLEQDDKAT